MYQWTKAVLIQPAIDRIFFFAYLAVGEVFNTDPAYSFSHLPRCPTYISGIVNTPETEADSLLKKIISAF